MHDRTPTTIGLLVVDDDAGIRTLLEITASLDPRFEVVGLASTGSEAIERVTSLDQVDIVLLDVTLPDRNGIELVSDLRHHASNRDVMIALFTGWTDSETIARAREAGADTVFGKDGDPRGLLDSLAELVSSGQ